MLKKSSNPMITARSTGDRNGAWTAACHKTATQPAKQTRRRISVIDFTSTVASVDGPSRKVAKDGIARRAIPIRSAPTQVQAAIATKTRCTSPRCLISELQAAVRRIAPKLRRHTVRCTNAILPPTTGAASFRRMLGSAPPQHFRTGMRAGRTAAGLPPVWTSNTHLGRRHTVRAWWAVEGDLDAAIHDSEAERSFPALRARDQPTAHGFVLPHGYVLASTIRSEAQGLGEDPDNDVAVGVLDGWQGVPSDALQSICARNIARADWLSTSKRKPGNEERHHSHCCGSNHTEPPKAGS